MCSSDLNLLTQGYQGQAAALSPYEAYLNQMKQLEALGQQSLDIGSGIGAKVANPSGGQFLMQGGTNAAQSNFAANNYNPFATALTQTVQNPAFQQGVGNLFGGGGGIDRAMYQSGNPLQTGQYADAGYWT